MNDLTKEASARAYEEGMNAYGLNNLALNNLGMCVTHNGNALGNANAGPIYGDKALNPHRQLTGKPGHYLTGYEGSRCDRINVLPKTDHQAEIDAYMDGHSEGMAAGMTLGDIIPIMEQSMEESRTGINLDKINRVSDDYRKISDEVEQEIGE